MDILRVNLDKWKVHIITLIVIAIVIHFVLKNQAKELRTDGEQPSADGNGRLYYLGRGSDKDSIEILLKRTYWSAYLFRRTSNWERSMLMSLFVLFIHTLVISFRKGSWKLPVISDLIITGIIIFFGVYFYTGFNYVHGDIFNDYNVRNNTKLVADKMGLDIDFTSDPPKPLVGPPDRTLVM